ncbi:MAG: glutamate--tRNA ligase [Deltaproteobacteria bacterium]|nr:glutamate--tRNA ligase [Deltaproteobacteria bacterium]
MAIPVPATPVRVRIAPSPTGDPHVGTAYIGLFNAAFALRHGGQFILRIEDTDQKRSTRQSETAIFDSLHWVGLRWDEGPDVGGPCGPYRQSERSSIYLAHSQLLLDNGTAYRCFCTAERLEAVRADQRSRKETARYDGFCRGLDPTHADRRAQQGEACVVRLRMRQEGETAVPDALRGQVVYDNRQIDDQVLIKSDGLPTYHLANVVDDHLMGITHVIRAEEWLNSTPKHLALYEAFGWTPPVFVHMPLLRNADKSKISKRKNPTSLQYYQRAGILPEAMLNFLALMGYSRKDEAGADIEKFGFAEFAADLELSRISLGGPVFDLEKLRWINGLYIRAMTPAELADRAVRWFGQDDRAAEIAALVQERVPELGDYMHHAGPFYRGSLDYGANARYLLVGCASRKKYAVRMPIAASRAFFEDVIAGLESLTEWSAPAIEAVLRATLATIPAAIGDGMMAVRVAVCGRPASPPLFESIAAIGRATVLVRLREVCNLLAEPRALADIAAGLRQELQATESALAAALGAPAVASSPSAAGST